MARGGAEQVDPGALHVEATPRGVVAGTDGRHLNGVLHADAWTVLGLATGALTLDEARIRIDGDPNAVRAVLQRPPPV